MTESGTPQAHTTPAIDEARRRRQDLQAALVDLEEAVTAPAFGRPEQWASLVDRRLDEVRAAFDSHVDTTEGPEGLFAEILSREPRLAHAVQKLRDDHVTLGASLDALAERLHPPGERPRGSTAADEVTELRRELLDVLTRFSRHRHRGADLVYECYNVDISPGD